MGLLVTILAVLGHFWQFLANFGQFFGQFFAVFGISWAPHV
jgi:hypothetical protein